MPDLAISNELPHESPLRVWSGRFQPSVAFPASDNLFWLPASTGGYALLDMKARVVFPGTGGIAQLFNVTWGDAGQVIAATGFDIRDAAGTTRRWGDVLGDAALRTSTGGQWVVANTTSVAPTLQGTVEINLTYVDLGRN